MLKDKKFWVGMALSVVLLAVSVRGVDFGEVWTALQAARWGWLGAALPLYLVGYWSRAKRVSQILAPIKKVPTARVLPPLVIGFMFNNVLPGRLGEFVFAWLLGKREGISRTASLAAVVISRILDGFTILAFFLFGWFAFLKVGEGAGPSVFEIGGLEFTRHELVGKVYLAGILGLVVFFLVFAACFALVAWKDFSLRLADVILGVFPARFSRLGKQAIEKFVTGLDILRQPGALVKVFLFNFIPWGLELFTYYFAARCFGLDLNLRQCALIMGMTNLAMIAPGGPGGVGLFEFGGLVCLALYGVEKPVALAYIVLVHAIILLPIDLWGAWYFWREGITVKQALEER